MRACAKTGSTARSGGAGRYAASPGMPPDARRCRWIRAVERTSCPARAGASPPWGRIRAHCPYPALDRPLSLDGEDRAEDRLLALLRPSGPEELHRRLEAEDAPEERGGWLGNGSDDRHSRA